MDVTRKEIAKALSDSLAINAVSLSYIKQWADNEILSSEMPDYEWTELSLSKTSGDAVKTLNVLSCGADDVLSTRILFNFYYKALKEKKITHSLVAKKLYFWILNSGFDGYSELYTFWDAIDLAIDGIFGDPAEIRNEFEAFLMRHMIDYESYINVSPQ